MFRLPQAVRKSACRAALVLSVAALGLVRAQGQGDDKVPPRGQMGHFTLKTTPEKAVAYLGGAKLGQTPVDTDFASGRYTLTIMLNGEEIVNKRVNIWPGQTTTIDTALALPYGSVTLNARPGVCTISVDGEQVGETKGGPLTINNLEAGTRIIKVTSRKTRRSKEISVNVLPEQTVQVDVNLGK